MAKQHSFVLEEINAQNWPQMDELPQIRWQLPPDGLGMARIVCISAVSSPFKAGWVLVELLRSQLPERISLDLNSVQNRRLGPVSSQHVSLMISEIQLRLVTHEEKFHLERILPQMPQLMRLASKLPDYRRYLCAIAHFLPAEKTREAWFRCAMIHRRWPKIWGIDLIEQLHKFLSISTAEWRIARSAEHLARVVSSAYFLGRQLEWREGQAATARHVRVRVFPGSTTLSSGKKQVLAVFVALNLDPDYEHFGLPHMMRAVAAIIPGAVVVSGSFMSHQRAYHAIRHLYAELEREDGREFTRKEQRLLTQELPRRFLEHVGQLTHAVYMHRNEEEVYRAVMTLSRELRYVRDLPQVVSWFEGQDHQCLTFCIVLVRLVSPQSLEAKQLLQSWPAGVQCMVDEVKQIGLLRKRYPKEACVFRLRFFKKAFLRKDYSIDLQQARQFVGHVLSATFGEVRDFNGGLILKRNEIFEDIEQQLTAEEKYHHILLEKLFFGLKPASMQSCLPAKAVLALFRLALQSYQMKSSPLTRYELVHSEIDGYLLVIVRADENTSQDTLERVTPQLQADPLDLAFTRANDNGYHLLGYIHNSRNLSEAHLWRASVKEVLQREFGVLRCRQQLRIHLTPERTSPDPRFSMARRSGSLIKMFYDGLTRIGRQDKPELAVAEHVDISNDRRTYTFLLRESYWSNGKPVTAQDFEFAWKKMIDFRARARYAYLMYPILGARAANVGELSLDAVGIRAANSRKLIVHLEHPAPYFLDLTAHWVYSPLCREEDEMASDWTCSRGDNFVCNGPFCLITARSRPGGQLRLMKNVRYWDANTVRLEQIDIHMAEDSREALNRFQGGEIDWFGDPVSELPADQIRNLKAKGLLETKPSTALYWYKINTNRWPFMSRRIRQAFAVALDRRLLISRLLHGNEIPAYSVVPPSMSCLEQQPYVDGDVERARQLFREGLEELGCEPGKLGSIILNYSQLEGHDLLAREAARQWREVLGVQIQLEGIPWRTYLDQTLNHDFQIALAIWYNYCNDPSFNLAHLRSRDEFVNATRWEHPAFQKIFEEIDREIDPHQRCKHLRAAEEFLVSEMPIIPLCSHNHYFVRRPEIKGVFVSNLGHIDFKWTHIEEESQ